MKGLNLQLKKAQEDGFLKERLINASKNEMDNVNQVINWISNSNKVLHEENNKIQAGIEEFNQTAESEMEKLSILNSQSDASLRDMTVKLNDSNAINNNLEQEFKNLVEVVKEGGDSWNKMQNEFSTLLCEIKHTTIQSGSRQSDLDLETQTLKQKEGEISRIRKQVDNLEANLADLQSQLSRYQVEKSKNSEHNSKLENDIQAELKIRSDIDNNIQYNFEENKRLVDKVSEYQTRNNYLDSLLKQHHFDSDKLVRDMRIFRLRGNELESRTSFTLQEL